MMRGSQTKLPRIAIASVPDHLHDRLFDQLDSYFPDAERCPVEQMSALPPAWVEIIAELVGWTTPLKVAATFYLAQLAKRAADHHWERREEIRAKVLASCGEAVDRLRELFRVFQSAQEDLGRPLGVIAGIDGPGDGQTQVRLSADDEAEFVEQLSLFVVHLEAIKAASELIAADGVEWKVFCRLSSDRFTLRWQDAGTRQPFEQDFKLDGTPLGERRPWVQPSLFGGGAT